MSDSTADDADLAETDELSSYTISRFDTSDATADDADLTETDELSSYTISRFDTSDATADDADLTETDELSSYTISRFDTSDATADDADLTERDELSSYTLSSLDTSDSTADDTDLALKKEICEAHDKLRARYEELLSSHASSGSFEVNKLELSSDFKPGCLTTLVENFGQVLDIGNITRTRNFEEVKSWRREVKLLRSEVKTLKRRLDKKTKETEETERLLFAAIDQKLELSKKKDEI
ncbi:uncharacterized protein LOC144630827 [Oculina patagonica]